MRIWVLSALAIAALTFGGSAADGAAVLHTAPSRLVVRLSDMPRGWTQTAAVSRSDAAADKLGQLAAGTLEHHGRSAEYETAFRHSKLAGLLDINDSVFEYRSSAGAQWQLSLSESRASKTYGSTHMRAIPVGRIGAQAVGSEWTGRTGARAGQRSTVFIVLFRRGNYAVQLLASGVPGKASPDEVIHLAHVIDGRIQRAR